MYSYTYKISLDGKTHDVISMMEDVMTEDELKFDSFIRFYEKEFNGHVEWEGNDYGPLDATQLRGETLEIFNRFQFEMIDVSEVNQPMPRLKRKKKSFWHL